MAEKHMRHALTFAVKTDHNISCLSGILALNMDYRVETNEQYLSTYRICTGHQGTIQDILQKEGKQEK